MRPYIEVWIDPDGVNGDVEVLGSTSGKRVIVTRGPEREVVHDTHPDDEEYKPLDGESPNNPFHLE